MLVSPFVLKYYKIRSVSGYPTPTLRISQGAVLSVCWTDKLAINEETERTGMMIQPGLMTNKQKVHSKYKNSPQDAIQMPSCTHSHGTLL